MQNESATRVISLLPSRWDLAALTRRLLHGPIRRTNAEDPQNSVAVRPGVVGAAVDEVYPAGALIAEVV